MGITDYPLSRLFAHIKLYKAGRNYAPNFVEKVQKDADRIHAQLDFVPGSNYLLEKLVSGKWDDQFYIAEPGTPVTQCDFFEWQKNDQRSVQISR